MRAFAESEVYITDGRWAGHRFECDRQPVSRLWFDAIDSGEFIEFVFTAPSQFGKTLIAFVVPLLFHTCEVEENYVLGVPYADMAANKFEIDILPTMKASPTMRHLVPQRGSGSGGGRVRDSITLANGNVIKLASAGAGDGGKAGFTARVIGITEAGQFSDIREASDEADPLRQLRARQRSYPFNERRTYVEGTQTRTDQLPESLRANSSNSQILSQHKACGKWVSPEREHLCGWQDAKTEHEAAKKACFCCPSCGEVISEPERRKMLLGAKLVHEGQKIDKNGKITGKKPETTRLWFRCSAWHNNFLSAGDIARDEWKAAQIAEDSPERISAERELCQFVWCIPWDPPKMDTELELDKKAIGERRLELPRGVVPSDTVALTGGVDLGMRQGWYLVLAKRADKSWHVVDYDPFDVPSDEMELEAAITTALRKLRTYFDAGYNVEGGGTRVVDEVWYDSGYKPKAVHNFVRPLSGTRRDAPDVIAYGRGTNMIERGTFVLPKKKTNSIRQIDPGRLWFMERDVEARINKLFWDADETKYQIMQALTLKKGMPGSITLYAGTDKIHERLQRHFTNEPLVTIQTALGEKTQFKRLGANHLLDAAANAWRAAHRFEWRKSQQAKTPSREANAGGSWYGDDAEEQRETRQTRAASSWYDED